MPAGKAFSEWLQMIQAGMQRLRQADDSGFRNDTKIMVDLKYKYHILCSFKQDGA
jgi:hypothetical protein